MFQPWRLKVREAEEALRNGHLEEASRLLAEHGLLEFLPAKRLMVKVVREMTQRAEQNFSAGATMAGWQDLAAAERLGAEPAEVAPLKRQFVDRGLSEAETYLIAGDPQAAVDRLDALERQGAAGRDFRLVREAAAKVLSAQRPLPGRTIHRGRERINGGPDLAARLARFGRDPPGLCPAGNDRPTARRRAACRDNCGKLDDSIGARRGDTRALPRSCRGKRRPASGLVRDWHAAVGCRLAGGRVRSRFRSWSANCGREPANESDGRQSRHK